MTDSPRQQHSECPTFNKHRSAASQIRYQALSAPAPFLGVLFERCEMWCTRELVSISWSFLTHSLRSNGWVFVEMGKTALAGVSRNLRRRMWRRKTAEVRLNLSNRWPSSQLATNSCQGSHFFTNVVHVKLDLYCCISWYMERIWLEMLKNFRSCGAQTILRYSSDSSASITVTTVSLNARQQFRVWLPAIAISGE